RAVIGVPSRIGRTVVLLAFTSTGLTTPREARASLRGRREVASRWGAKAGRCNLYGALGAARRQRAGRYAQSSQPRPRGTWLAGGELWAISCAATPRRMP